MAALTYGHYQCPLGWCVLRWVVALALTDPTFFLGSSLRAASQVSNGGHEVPV